MPTSLPFFTGLQYIPNGSTANIQPPVSEEWVLKSAAGAAGLTVKGYDSVALVGFALFTNQGSSSANYDSTSRIHIGLPFNNTYYIQLTNNSGGDSSFHYGGIKVTGLGLTGKFLYGTIAVGATATIRPPVGKVWIVHNYWHAEDITCGLNGYQVASSGATSVTGPMPKVMINNTYYMTLKNNSSTSVRAYRMGIIEVSDTMFDVSGATLFFSAGQTSTIRPPAGELWLITALASDSGAWDIRPQFTDGITSTADVHDTAYGWGNHMPVGQHFFISNSHYLRISNTAAVTRTVVYTRYLVP